MRKGLWGREWMKFQSPSPHSPRGFATRLSKTLFRGRLQYRQLRRLTITWPNFLIHSNMLSSLQRTRCFTWRQKHKLVWQVNVHPCVDCTAIYKIRVGVCVANFFPLGIWLLFLYPQGIHLGGHFMTLILCIRCQIWCWSWVKETGNILWHFLMSANI